MAAINERIRQGETVVTALIPPGDEIHQCPICGNEINIADEVGENKDYSMVDQGFMKTVWHRSCYDSAKRAQRVDYKNTLLRIE